MRLNIFLIILFIASLGWSQSYFKGPALIETPTIVSTAAGTTTLTKDSNTVLSLTGTLTQTVKLPDATTIPLGRYFELWNGSTQDVTVVDDGSNTLRVIPAGMRVKAVVKSVVTANGTWLVETLTASNITNVPAGTVAATNVQAAIDEISSDVTSAFNSLNTTSTRLLRALSTGVINGLDISVNADPTKFDIAAGMYDIIDISTPALPAITSVSFGGVTGVSVTNIATHDVTFLMLDSSGAIIQSTTYPTPQERRTYAFIGRLNHSNRTDISFADTFPDFSVSFVGSFYDLVDALAPFRLTDFTITTNGANLSFNRQAGSVFFRSSNYSADKTNPHIQTYASQTLQPFKKMTQTAFVDPTSVTVLDPTNYDNAGTVTAVGGSTSRSTIQRVFLYKSGAVGVQYGQTIYSTFPDAVAAVTTETFVENPTIKQTAVMIAMVVLRRNCTSLLDTTCAKIVPVNRFGGLGGGGGGGGASDLQGAYDNSTSPQLTLNSTQSSLLLRDASTPIATTLFAVQNNAGSTTYLGVDTNGISTNNFVGTGTTGAVRVHNLTTTEKNALTPAAGMVVYDTTLSQFQGYNGTWGQLVRDLQSSDLTMTASDTLAISLTHAQQTWLIQGNSAAVTMSTTPFGSSTPLNGAEIILIGNSDANAVTFVVNDAAKGIIGYGFTLGKGQVATVKYNSTLDRYVVKSLSN